MVALVQLTFGHGYMFNTIKVYAFIDLTHIINEINYLHLQDYIQEYIGKNLKVSYVN